MKTKNDAIRARPPTEPTTRAPATIPCCTPQQPPEILTNDGSAIADHMCPERDNPPITQPTGRMGPDLATHTAEAANAAAVKANPIQDAHPDMAQLIHI